VARHYPAAVLALDFVPTIVESVPAARSGGAPVPLVRPVGLGEEMAVTYGSDPTGVNYLYVSDDGWEQRMSQRAAERARAAAEVEPVGCQTGDRNMPKGHASERGALEKLCAPALELLRPR
jgi:hypothetical protein